MSLEPLLRDATALLGPVEVVDELTSSSRATVARVRLVDDGGRGPTVIVKRPVEAEARARELEALRTLPEAVRPALLAHDDRVVVTEDLGPGPSLADLLLGDDAGATEAGLLAWARALGGALRVTMRAGEPPERPDLAEGVHHLRLCAVDLDVPVPAGIDEDAERLASRLAEPSPWLAFCPGDTCPDNNRIGPGGAVRFFDFEGAGWRHAALEAAYCRVPFCTCWCVARLPDGMTRRMEETFVAALSPPDPDRFAGVIDLAAVSYTVASFRWFRAFVVSNRPPGPPGRTPGTGRQYVYPRLLALAAMEDELPGLATLAGTLAGRVVERWPEAAAMPLYPAFTTGRT